MRHSSSRQKEAAFPTAELHRVHIETVVCDDHEFHQFRFGSPLAVNTCNYFVSFDLAIMVSIHVGTECTLCKHVPEPNLAGPRGNK